MRANKQHMILRVLLLRPFFLLLSFLSTNKHRKRSISRLHECVTTSSYHVVWVSHKFFLFVSLLYTQNRTNSHFNIDIIASFHSIQFCILYLKKINKRKIEEKQNTLSPIHEMKLDQRRENYSSFTSNRNRIQTREEKIHLKCDRSIWLGEWKRNNIKLITGPICVESSIQSTHTHLEWYLLALLCHATTST